MRNWILLCGCLAIGLVDGAAAERKERLLHVPGSVLLLGYAEDDTLFVTRDGEELTLQPPGPNRAGHHTYPSLSRDGTLVATSYVKSPYPHYREGIATYSLVDNQWKEYSGGDYHLVWAVSLSPDGTTLAFKAERNWEQPRQLLQLDLKTGDTTVLIEPFWTSPPVSWSPDGRYITYIRAVRGQEDEIVIRDLRNQQEHRVVAGYAPSWSPSGEWIAYFDGTGAAAIVHPDGTGGAALVSLRRTPPWLIKRGFMDPAVWSPDSKSLLLNESANDETARALIHQFDLASRKLRKKTGKGVAVLGWTRSKSSRSLPEEERGPVQDD